MAQDLWGSKARTVLVVLSIAIGVFAVGVVTQTFTAVQDGLMGAYPRSNPPNATLLTSEFDEDLLQSIRHMPGIEAAEGQTAVQARVLVGPNEWKPLVLYSLHDYRNNRIDKVSPQMALPSLPGLGAERGVWPPPDRGVVMERSSFASPGMLPAGIQVGQSIRVRTADNREYELRLAGVAYAPGHVPAGFTGGGYGYISLDTLEWLTGARTMNQLNITVAEDKLNRQHIGQVAAEVRNKIENAGYTVSALQIPTPGKHPLSDTFQGLLLLLNVLGIGALALSGFLIVNTLSAQLAQQVRQIGMMKAVGASRRQIAGIYVAMVLVYGFLALCIAAPLSALASAGATRFLADFLNVDAPGLVLSPSVIVLQAAMTFLIPLLAAIAPILNGTRITVREALSDYGISAQGRGQTARGRKRLTSFPRFSLSSLLSRPVVLSLRNTFRRKGRLALTLTTLVLSGALFVSVFSVRAAMFQTLDDALDYWKFDVMLPLGRPYSIDLLQQQALQIPGVVHAESWGNASVRRWRANDTESENITLFAPPPETTMLHPTMIAGRWLMPGDENAIVLSNGVVREEQDVKVGDTITLKIDAKKSDWVVVGIARVVANFGSGIGTAYANYPYYAQTVDRVGKASSIQVTTDAHDAVYQKQVELEMQRRFDALGIRYNSGLTSGAIRQQNETVFNILVFMLLFLAILMAGVGGLGLMGTMSLNVLERTREIGVMRAVGASNGTIRQIVLIEGVIIGLVSWLLGVALSVPFGKLLSDALGAAVFQLPLHYQVSVGGIIAWWFIVAMLSTAASLLPAMNASRLTVRQVLSYE